MSAKNRKRKEEPVVKDEPFKLSHALLFAFLPIVFGLLGIISIDVAQPLTAILLGSCIFLVVLSVVFTIFMRIKGIPYSKEIEEHILRFSLFYMLIHFNVPSLYLVRGHLFWFCLLIVIWLVTCSTMMAVYLRARNKMSKLKYESVKKYYNRFSLWVGGLSFLSFLLSTLGYNQVRSYDEDIQPPAVFFLGENSGHIVIMLSFSIAMTIIYGYGIFMTSERIFNNRKAG
ncbi:hypothetical protein [Rossellomorea sp. BNER]|uniref:hypothetical protein n=1 Tax=Rossellomorea sp. BNER TaxID=2962031 RepID=UPI003AF25A6B|nr:hypothetical protein [Rossellomorea sp. BNER]